MKKSGFTLIELLMASVILTVLAAIAIPNFTRMQIRAKESEVKSVAHSVQVAVEDFKTTPGFEGLKPTNVASFVTYLPTSVTMKRNPFNQAQTYTGGQALLDGVVVCDGNVGYSYANQNTNYTIVGIGKNAVQILTLIEGQ